MFLTSAKDVAVEYKYVWCNTRSCLKKTTSHVEHGACFCIRRHIVSFVTLEVLLAFKWIYKECWYIKLFLYVPPLKLCAHHLRNIYLPFITKERAWVGGNECCWSVGFRGFMSKSHAPWDQYDSRLMCTFIVTEISCFKTRTTKLHLTKNKRLSDEAPSLASTRFVQAVSLSGTDVYHYWL